jgi:hypothetical protein
MLPATASDIAVTILPATATLPAVAIEPATAVLATVAAEVTTPALATVAADPATAVLATVAADPATAELAVVDTEPTTAVLAVRSATSIRLPSESWEVITGSTSTTSSDRIRTFRWLYGVVDYEARRIPRFSNNSRSDSDSPPQMP